MAVFRDCVICKGDRHRPRNGKGGNTCSASQCKKSYQAQREMQQQLGGNELPSVASFNELLPENKTVRELNQILGERCCEPHKLSPKKRRGGPGSSYCQQFLVRGNFLESGPPEAEEEDDDVESDDYEETLEPGMYWVDADTLVGALGPEPVKVALMERQKRVLGDLEAACTAARKQARGSRR